MMPGAVARDPTEALPLPSAGRGRIWSVAAVAGLDRQGRRLAEMGFVAGAPVELLRSDGHGMVVVRVGETRLAMNRDMADRIRVRQTPETRLPECRRLPRC